MALSTAVPASERTAIRKYAALEERILERDQVGASEILYQLIREGRPLAEMLGETVRIHAPYTSVPYHQRLDDGFARFVNNDHCLLSARASLRLPGIVSEELRFLPLAQTLWYVPTGLDPWNQLLGNVPGHYSRRTYDPSAHETVPAPQTHWEDQEPLYLDGTYEERLNQWLTLVQRGEVIESYRVFLGLVEDDANRPKLMAQLVFAGLIDVQDRMLYNRSYTTGHKSYRARATVELSEAVGWENAHGIFYAGVPDLAVGPRWYSSYEMACQVSLVELAEELPESTLDPTPTTLREERLLANAGPLSEASAASLVDALTREREPAYIEAITSLLLGGTNPRQIIDAMQIAAARLLLETVGPRNFSMPQHAYEYTNTLGWFFDRFKHQHRLKLLYVAGSFINQTAFWLQNQPDQGAEDTSPPRGSEAISQHRLLERVDEAVAALDPPQSVAWTRAYLDGGYDRGPLVETLAVAAAKQGNDPHNQEIGLCLLEDYLHSNSAEREQLLLASAQHTAGHMKYGDSMEAYRRFAEAFDIESNQQTQGGAEPEEALLDD